MEHEQLPFAGSMLVFWHAHTHTPKFDGQPKPKVCKSIRGFFLKVGTETFMGALSISCMESEADTMASQVSLFEGSMRAA